jgi:hypothetical protein
MTEKPMDVIPILIDLDFRQPVQAHQYTKDQIEAILKTIFLFLEEYLKLDSMTLAFVLEKPARPSKVPVEYKDGIHIQIPDVVTHPDFQAYMRERIMNELSDILAPSNYTNNITDIYDACVTKNNWLMYGSKKPDEPIPWRVTRVYAYNKWSRESRAHQGQRKARDGCQ